METATQDSIADSSPAIEVPRESEAYAEWRMTGKLPEAKPAEKKTPAAGKQPEGTTAPASETGNPQEKKGKSAAAQRLDELLADLKRANLTPEELKTFKREAQGQTPQQQERSAAAAKSASEQTANPTEKKAPAKPKAEDFKTFQEFEDAKDKYYEDLTDYKAWKATEEFRAGEAQKAAITSTNAKIADAAKRYGPEADGVIREASKAFYEVKDGKPVPTVPMAVYSLVDGSPVWADLAYTLGQKPEELKSFIELANSDPGAAIRKLVLMEHLIKEELGKGSGKGDEGEGTERDATGRFKKSPPEKKESDAPRPPREVSGRGTPPPDETERAIKDNDARAYFRAQNAKDLARRRG